MLCALMSLNCSKLLFDSNKKYNNVLLIMKTEVVHTLWIDITWFNIIFRNFFFYFQRLRLLHINFLFFSKKIVFFFCSHCRAQKNYITSRSSISQYITRNFLSLFPIDICALLFELVFSIDFFLQLHFPCWQLNFQ